MELAFGVRLDEFEAPWQKQHSLTKKTAIASLKHTPRIVIDEHPRTKKLVAIWWKTVFFHCRRPADFHPLDARQFGLYCSNNPSYCLDPRGNRQARWISLKNNIPMFYGEHVGKVELIHQGAGVLYLLIRCVQSYRSGQRGDGTAAISPTPVPLGFSKLPVLVNKVNKRPRTVLPVAKARLLHAVSAFNRNIIIVSLFNPLTLI